MLQNKSSNGSEGPSHPSKGKVKKLSSDGLTTKNVHIPLDSDLLTFRKTA